MVTVLIALAVGFGAIGLGAANGVASDGKPISGGGNHVKGSRKAGKPRD